MNRDFSARNVQLLVALVYATLLAAALLRAPSPVTAGCALALGCGAYATGREIPDVRIAPALLPRTAGIAATLALLGIGVLLQGGSDALAWLAVAMGYGTGNRLRAGGFLRR